MESKSPDAQRREHHKFVKPLALTLVVHVKSLQKHSNITWIQTRASLQGSYSHALWLRSIRFKKTCIDVHTVNESVVPYFIKWMITTTDQLLDFLPTIAIHSSTCSMNTWWWSSFPCTFSYTRSLIHPKHSQSNKLQGSWKPLSTCVSTHCTLLQLCWQIWWWSTPWLGPAKLYTPPWDFVTVEFTATHTRQRLLAATILVAIIAWIVVRKQDPTAKSTQISWQSQGINNGGNVKEWGTLVWEN